MNRSNLSIRKEFLLWNRESPLYIVTIGIFVLLTFSSCCNQKDRVSWFPDEAVRYYNENDTVKFYCPESDVFETYVVCVRDTGLNIEQLHSSNYCEYTSYRYTMIYVLRLDSCSSSRNIMFGIDNAHPGAINVSIRDTANAEGLFVLDFNETSIFSTDVLGYTYHNVIEIPGNERYDGEAILFSYEYGVIQIKYEDQTFSLVNNEN